MIAEIRSIEFVGAYLVFDGVESFRFKSGRSYCDVERLGDKICIQLSRKGKVVFRVKCRNWMVDRLYSIGVRESDYNGVFESRLTRF